MDSSIPERYNYQYQIRMLNTEDHIPDNVRIVAVDAFEALKHAYPEAIHLRNVDDLLDMIAENEKEVLYIPTPYGDLPMQCIFHKAWINLHGILKVSFTDYPWIPATPDIQIVHRTVQKFDERIRRGISFIEALLFHYTHEIRIVYADDVFGEFYVAEDVCNALGFDKETSTSALAAVDDSMKRMLTIEEPIQDEELWCVHGDALDTLMSPSGTTFSDHLWMTVLPSRDTFHDVRRGKSKKISVIEKAFFASRTDKSQTKDPKFAEREIELALEAKLIAQGIEVERQVLCEAGRADVVTPDTIYEIKDILSQRKLRDAVAQVLSYRACINPKAKAVVIGRKHHKYNPDTKFAKRLGVKVIVWEDETETKGQ